jgi:hypothetical protein
LKKRFEVYQVFLNFQQLVEQKFDRKIITMQIDWGGEYDKLNSFFRKVGIYHHVSCPHAHQQNGSAEGNTIILLKLVFPFLQMHLCL